SRTKTFVFFVSSRQHLCADLCVSVTLWQKNARTRTAQQKSQITFVRLRGNVATPPAAPPHPDASPPTPPPACYRRTATSTASAHASASPPASSPSPLRRHRAAPDPHSCTAAPSPPRSRTQIPPARSPY